MQRRVPRGTRGLKQHADPAIKPLHLSRPAWDAGIETMSLMQVHMRLDVASRVGRGD